MGKTSKLLISFLSLFLFGCSIENVNRLQSISTGFQIPQSDLNRYFEESSGLIAYIGTDGNIYTIDQLGEQQTQVTSDGNLRAPALSQEEGERGDQLVFHSLPTWSPVEQRLVFSKVSVNRGQRLSVSSSVTAMADGSGYSELSQSPFNNIYYYWSPDGSQVAALTLAPANTLKLQQLGVTFESASEPVFDIGQPFYFDWSPDSQQMLTHIGTSQFGEKVSILALADRGSSDNLSPTMLEEVLKIEPARFTAPDWSPDGRSILLPRYATNPTDDDTVLVSRDLTTRVDRIIAKYDGDVRMNAAWSPTNRHISFIPSREDDRIIGQLFVVDAATKQDIGTEHNDIVAYFWSPDGSQIAYITHSALSSEAEAANKHAESKLISNQSGAAQLTPVQSGGPRSNRFGLYVLDLSSGQTIQLLDPFVPTQNFFADAISFFDQYQRSATIWSPNSQYLVLPVQREQESQILVLHAKGWVAPKQVANGLLAYWSFQE